MKQDAKTIRDDRAANVNERLLGGYLELVEDVDQRNTVCKLGCEHNKNRCCRFVDN